MNSDIEQLMREAMAERADRVAQDGLRNSSFEPGETWAKPPRRRVALPVASGVAVAAAVAVGVALLPGASPTHRTMPVEAASGASARGTGTDESPGAPPTQQPGGQIVTPLAAPTTVTGAGTQQVQLGAPPAGTNAIAIRFACLSAGSFWFGPRGTDGPGETCGNADVAEQSKRPSPSFTLPVKPGQHGTTITATAGARWRLTATYSRATTSPWGINAHGKTYGIANSHGTPDLIAAFASNGAAGYIRRDEINAYTRAGTLAQVQAQIKAQQSGHNPSGSGKKPRIPVYKSDGVTQIGWFVIGGHGYAWTAQDQQSWEQYCHQLQATHTGSC